MEQCSGRTGPHFSISCGILVGHSETAEFRIVLEGSGNLVELGRDTRIGSSCGHYNRCDTGLGFGGGWWNGSDSFTPD